MPHASSLRAIGQTLETAHIEAFALDKKNNSYVVRSESLTPTRQWILMRKKIQFIAPNVRKAGSKPSSQTSSRTLRVPVNDPTGYGY